MSESSDRRSRKAPLRYNPNDYNTPGKSQGRQKQSAEVIPKDPPVTEVASPSKRRKLDKVKYNDLVQILKRNLDNVDLTDLKSQLAFKQEIYNAIEDKDVVNLAVRDLSYEQVFGIFQLRNERLPTGGNRFLIPELIPPKDIKERMIVWPESSLESIYKTHDLDNAAGAVFALNTIISSILLQVHEVQEKERANDNTLRPLKAFNEMPLTITLDLSDKKLIITGRSDIVFGYKDIKAATFGKPQTSYVAILEAKSTSTGIMDKSAQAQLIAYLAILQEYRQKRSVARKGEESKETRTAVWGILSDLEYFQFFVLREDKLLQQSKPFNSTLPTETPTIAKYIYHTLVAAATASPATTPKSSPKTSPHKAKKKAPSNSQRPLIRPLHAKTDGVIDAGELPSPYDFEEYQKRVWNLLEKNDDGEE